MSRRAVTVWVSIGVAAAIVVAGLSVLFIVRLGHGGPAVPAGDALLNLDGVAAAAGGSKQVQVNLGGDPAQHYSGLTGCASRHFVAYYGGAPTAPLLIAYTAAQATVAYSKEVYRFDEGPMLQSGILVWRGDFGPNGTFGQISLQVGCPPP